MRLYTPRVLEELQERDRRDADRAVAPLRVARDAWVLDTTELDADAAFAAARRSHRERACRPPSSRPSPEPHVRARNPSPSRKVGRRAPLAAPGTPSGAGMQEATATIEPRPSLDDFAAMLDETLGSSARLEGTVVTRHRGRHRRRRSSSSTSASSPRAACRSRSSARRGSRPRSGSATRSRSIVERFENKSGEVVLSREKARREESWNRLERAFTDTSKVEGHIFGRVKGGFAVDLGGAVAFLPGSQVDIRPVRDVGPLINKTEPFLILKMDRRRGNIVVSRRAVLEESRAEQRNELLATLRRARSWTAWSRTSPTTAPSSTWAASTACSTSPTSPGSASTTRATCWASARTSRSRSSASTARPSASASA